MIVQTLSSVKHLPKARYTVCEPRCTQHGSIFSSKHCQNAITAIVWMRDHSTETKCSKWPEAFMKVWQHKDLNFDFLVAAYKLLSKSLICMPWFPHMHYMANGYNKSLGFLTALSKPLCSCHMLAAERNGNIAPKNIFTESWGKYFLGFTTSRGHSAHMDKWSAFQLHV